VNLFRFFRFSKLTDKRRVVEEPGFSHHVVLSVPSGFEERYPHTFDFAHRDVGELTEYTPLAFEFSCVVFFGGVAPPFFWLSMPEREKKKHNVGTVLFHAELWL
jgi:hypothetical protein